MNERSHSERFGFCLWTILLVHGCSKASPPENSKPPIDLKHEFPALATTVTELEGLMRDVSFLPISSAQIAVEPGRVTIDWPNSWKINGTVRSDAKGGSISVEYLGAVLMHGEWLEKEAPKLRAGRFWCPQGQWRIVSPTSGRTLLEEKWDACRSVQIVIHDDRGAGIPVSTNSPDDRFWLLSSQGFWGASSPAVAATTKFGAFHARLVPSPSLTVQVPPPRTDCQGLELAVVMGGKMTRDHADSQKEYVGCTFRVPLAEVHGSTDDGMTAVSIGGIAAGVVFKDGVPVQGTSRRDLTVEYLSATEVSGSRVPLFLER